MAYQSSAHGRPLVIQGNFQGRLPAFTAQARPAFPQIAQRRRAPEWHTAQPSRIGDAFQVPPTVNLSRAGLGRPLPEAVRQKMESFFSADFSDVRVHVGAQAQQIGAVAFTMGSEIHFAPGHYNPATSHGQRLLGHELTHVVQQRSGRVRNPFGTGVAVVQDPAMEAEAERMGTQAAMHQAPAAMKPQTQETVQQTPNPTHGGRPLASHVQAAVAQTSNRPAAPNPLPGTGSAPPQQHSAVQRTLPNPSRTSLPGSAQTIQPSNGKRYKGHIYYTGKYVMRPPSVQSHDSKDFMWDIREFIKEMPAWRNMQVKLHKEGHRVYKLEIFLFNNSSTGIPKQTCYVKLRRPLKNRPYLRYVRTGYATFDLTASNAADIMIKADPIIGSDQVTLRVEGIYETVESITTKLPGTKQRVPQKQKQTVRRPVQFVVVEQTVYYSNDPHAQDLKTYYTIIVEDYADVEKEASVPFDKKELLYKKHDRPWYESLLGSVHVGRYRIKWRKRKGSDTTKNILETLGKLGSGEGLDLGEGIPEFSPPNVVYGSWANFLAKHPDSEFKKYQIK